MSWPAGTGPGLYKQIIVTYKTETNEQKHRRILSRGQKSFGFHDPYLQYKFLQHTQNYNYCQNLVETSGFYAFLTLFCLLKKSMM